MISKYLIIFTISFNFALLAKEIPLKNSSIRFFESDIELATFITKVFEDYDFKGFSYKKLSYLRNKFKDNLVFLKYKKPLILISKINAGKGFSKILKHCKSFNDLNIDDDVKFRVSTHCFDKLYHHKMKLENFYKLSSTIPKAFIKRRIKNQSRYYLKKHNVKQIEKPTQKNHLVKNDFIKLIKEIRKISHSQKKNTKLFSKKMSQFYKFLLNEDILKNSDNLKNIEHLVKTLNRHDKADEARKISSHVVKITSNNQDIFYYELLWSYISRNEYKKALKNVIHKFGLNFNYRTFDNTKLKFWIAHTLEVNDIVSFKDIYQDIIDNHPLSFYAIISYNRIKNLNKKSKLELIEDSSMALENHKFNLSKLSLDRLVFIRSLIANNSIFILSEQIEEFLKDNSTKDNSFNEKLYLSLALFMQSNNSYLESFKIVYRGINKKIISVNDKVLKLLYPRPYLDIIAKQNKEFDSYLALSLMRQESSFNREANSRVGALGLMQLMPNTAKSLKRSVSEEDLYNPKTNISLGVQYLNHLSKRFNENFVHTLSAYNAGERNVKRWKRNYFISDSLLKNIENIPFLETRKYVKLIFRNIFYYNYLDKIEGREPATDTNRLFEKYLQVKR